MEKVKKRTKVCLLFCKTEDKVSSYTKVRSNLFARIIQVVMIIPFRGKKELKSY